MIFDGHEVTDDWNLGGRYRIWDKNQIRAAI